MHILTVCCASSYCGHSGWENDTTIWSYTFTVCRYGNVGISIYGIFALDLEQFFERLNNKDDRNKGGEALLRKSGNIFDQGAQIEDHDDQDHCSCPKPDPAPSWEEIPAIVSVKQQ